MDQPLVPGGEGGGVDHNVSPSSQQPMSGSSLAEQIRLQREREAANHHQQQQHDDVTEPNLMNSAPATTTSTATSTSYPHNIHGSGGADIESNNPFAGNGDTPPPTTTTPWNENTSVPNTTNTNFAHSTADTMSSVNPPVQIPTYGPIGGEGIGGGSGGNTTGGSSFGFSSLTSAFGVMTNGTGARRNNGGSGSELHPTEDISQGLLSSSGGGDDQQQYNDDIRALDPNNSDAYSMTAYFYMFVMDIYNGFRSLPIPVQALILVLLLWIAWKLF